MALTPLDIHNKEFDVKLRGYDKDEVKIGRYSSFARTITSFRLSMTDASSGLKC